jgi:eukaryotic-like serine/threonine-protein kinase
MSAAAEQITNSRQLPAKVGRFDIVRCLGKGAQGVVYLAHDPELDRQVAIKTLDKRRRDHSNLLQEARNVSKLEHLNIIPIYEIGVHEDSPYLVYQFCEGESLQNVLKDKGRMKALEAVNISRQLLDAMGYAHRSGIVHRDLNPANIMIDKDNVPRIMDFGISIMIDTDSNTKDVVGTVNYMAPEQIAAGEIGPSVDIFAIGLILYEMLTAHQVYSADNSMAVMFKITNENVLPPSSREASIELKLDTLVMHALEKDVSKRFESAVSMKAELDLYAQASEPNTAPAEAGSGNLGTVDFLLRRMQRKQDFPAISTNITQITHRSSNQTSSTANELANIILKDYALTTKLLRLVNASFYGQFGGEITTISRAVIILGFEQVRAAALSIILFEHLQNNSQAKELKSAACGALMSGIISREQASQMSNIDANSTETAYIASMFHKLGRQLTIYYFPEEYQEITGLINNKGMEEQQAVRAVLGVAYDDLGMAIAKEWKLPDIIVNSIQRMPDGPVAKAKSLKASIAQLACFSNELCEIGMNGKDNNDVALSELAERYGKSIGIKKKDMQALVDSSKKEMKEFTKALNIDVSDVKIFPEAQVPKQSVSSSIAATANYGTTEMSAASGTSGGGDSEIEKVEKQADGSVGDKDALVRGIAEITDVMLSEFKLNDVLTMILENIYSGMGFTRVLFCIYDRKNNQIVGRFGLGKQVDEIATKFRAKIEPGNDIISTAVNKGKDFIVLDTNSEEYKQRIPQWLRQLCAPQTVVAYPLVLNKRCIGMIYADTDDAATNISMEALGFFKTLRNQASMAIQQSQMR